MLETEAQMNASVADSALRDRLAYRQDFCDLVNSVFGLGISVEIHPSLLGTSMVVGDFNGDGTSDELEQQEGSMMGGVETEDE